MIKRLKIKNKKQFYFIVIVFLLLVLFATSLIYPDYFKKSVKSLEERIVPPVSSFVSQLKESFNKPFELGWEFAGGTKLVYQPTLADEERKISGEGLMGIKDVLEQRFEVYGVEAKVRIDKEKIVVESGKEDEWMVGEIMNQGFSVNFREESEEGNYFQPTELTGEYLDSVSFAIDQTDNGPLILLQFTEEGAEVLATVTKRNEGKRLGIYVDEMPTIPLQITGAVSGDSFQIKMNASLESVKKLTRMIGISALSPSLELSSQAERGAEEAGAWMKNTIKASLFIFLIGFWLMVVFYKIGGLIAFILLLIEADLLLLICKVRPIVLSLGSFGGLWLSVILGLISLIVVLKEIKKELKKGKSFGIAVEEGFETAASAVKRINFFGLFLLLVLFVGASKLFFEVWLIHNFILVSFIGILLNLFLSLFLLKRILMLFENSRLSKTKILWQ